MKRLVVFFVALATLLPVGALAQNCPSIAGNWNFTEYGSEDVSVSAQGQSQSESVSVPYSSTTVQISQSGCNFQYSLTGIGTYSGTISGNSITVQGPALPASQVSSLFSAVLSGGTLNISSNQQTGSGSLSGKQINLTSTGNVSGSGSYEGVSFNLTIQINLTVTMTQLSPVSITTSSLPEAFLGSFYNQTLQATGGSAPYSWSIASGQLPPGLNLGSAGTISGTSTAAGTSSFTAQVTDASGGTATVSLQITTSAALVITPATLPQGEVGTAYSQTLTASGGTPPYTWNPIGAQVPGLTLSSSGVISGTPTSASPTDSVSGWLLGFRLVDSAGGVLSSPSSYGLTVQQQLKISTGSTLPAGSVGTAYSQTLATTGGVSPFTWSVTSGQLLAGLSLGTNGSITGTPMAGGADSFSVTVGDTLGGKATVAFQLKVIAPAAVISGLSSSSAIAGGAAFTLTVNGSGFLNGSTIEWSGSPVTTSYISATQLSATISANLIASAGSVSITAVNPGASPSNTVSFTINPAPPAISGLSPNSATAAGPKFTLTVNGIGFVSGSNVQWNGSAVATTYVSATQLTATIPATLIASAGGASVTVLNISTGTSNAVTFVVFSPNPNVQTISHIADGGGWRTSIILMNTDTVPALYTVSFQSDSGASYVPPLALGSATGTIPVGGSTIIETADTASALSEGWAQVTSSQSVSGTAIFRYDPWSQEAAVPLLTTGGTKLEIPYQVGNGLVLGVALANPSATQTASLTEVIRGQSGNQLASRTLTLAPLNHTAFNPTFPSGITGGGVVEYDSNVNVFGLGIRSAPEGTGLAFTSLDAVLPLAASAKTISHIADGGNWRTSIILINTDTVPALYTVSFQSDSGASYVPPLASGTATGSIPVGGSTIIETADTASSLAEGWAQVTSSQSIGGTAIFRYDPWSQEAAVPLLTSGGTKLEIPYQVGNGLALGVALANPSATQTAIITEIIRDQNGNELASRTLTLAPLNHTAFNPTFPSGITGGGVVEYDSNVTLFGLGIRSAPEGTGLAFTSVRAAYK